jgi:hypothetical protein
VYKVSPGRTCGDESYLRFIAQRRFRHGESRAIRITTSFTGEPLFVGPTYPSLPSDSSGPECALGLAFRDRKALAFIDVGD